MLLSAVNNFTIVAATLNADQGHFVSVPSVPSETIFDHATNDAEVSHTLAADLDVTVDQAAAAIDSGTAFGDGAADSAHVGSVIDADIGIAAGSIFDQAALDQDVSHTPTTDELSGLHLDATNAADAQADAVVGSQGAVSTIAAADIGATVGSVTDAVDGFATILGASDHADITTDSNNSDLTSPELSQISEIDKASGGEQTLDTHNFVSSVISSMFETVKLPSSGLVFNNTYESDVSTPFRDAIVQAEHFLQQHFADSVTLNVDFNMHADAFQNQDGSASTQFSAWNNWDNAKIVTYAQLTSALAALATTTDDLAAVSSFPSADPSHGGQWIVPVGMAENLGLVDPSSKLNPVDDTISLNPHVTWAFDQDAVGELIHEMTEGLFGRVSELGYRGGQWAPMDLFRYAESANGPVHDYSGGLDGKAAYFSVDGQTLLTQFHNPIDTKGGDDGADFADWDGSVKGDAFGSGGPGSPGNVTDADVRVLDILGWTPALPYGQILKQVEPGAPFHGQGEGGSLILDGATTAVNASDAFHFDNLTTTPLADHEPMPTQTDLVPAYADAHLGSVVESLGSADALPLIHELDQSHGLFIA